MTIRNAIKGILVAAAIALMSAVIGLGYADAPSYLHSNAGN
jgi:hypothetical protein